MLALRPIAAGELLTTAVPEGGDFVAYDLDMATGELVRVGDDVVDEECSTTQ